MEFSKHTDGTTSVKVHHAPGGKSNFSLGWDEPKPATKSTPVQPPAQQKQQQPQPTVASTNSTAGYSQKGQQQQQQQQQQPAGKTSVKVHNPPGGKSNFTLG